MSLDISNGAWFVVGDDGQWSKLGDCLSSNLEYESLVDRAQELLFDKTKAFHCECELNACDLEMLFQASEPPLSQNFTIEYNIPIIIQARWHKKAKVRKKWLHRYGMRPDTVHVKTDNVYLSEHDGCIEFETESLRYIWKSHQQRKGLKIEM